MMNTRGLNVAMYSPFPLGGMPRYTMEVMRTLHERHGKTISVELVTSSDLDQEFRNQGYAVNDILPVLDRSDFPSRWSWFFSRVTYYVKRDDVFLAWLRGRADISAVHFQDYHPWILPNAVDRCKRLGKAVFFTVHNIRPHSYPALVPASLIDLLNRRAWKMCNALFVHGERLREELSAFLGSGSPPIHVIPHGTWSHAGNHAIPPLRNRLASRRILFFGTIRANKGLDVLLYAMRKLPGYSLTIAGAQDDRAYWNNTIHPMVQELQRKGTTIHVRDGFVPQDEVSELFLNHSLLALPYTRFTSQSGVLYLALAHETPVVATRTGGLEETITAYRVGEIAAAGDPDDFAAAITRIYDTRNIDALEERLQSARQQLGWGPAADIIASAYAACSPVVDSPGKTVEELYERHRVSGKAADHVHL